MDKVTILQIRDIEEKLRNDFKAACAKQGKTMKQVLEQLMFDFVEETEKKAGKNKTIG